MSRYIDADKLLRRIESKLGVLSLDYLLESEKAIVEVISSAPSIDIVHCEECKHWIDDRKAEEDMGICELTYYFTNADDFCSYGSRSEKPNNSTISKMEQVGKE